MLLSIIIVNYKSAVLINNCLVSLLANTNDDLPYEVIIVDNDSRDDSQQIITTNFPFVRWIQMNYNAGFARANNEGIRQSKCDTVLLLNPDTLFKSYALDCYFTFTKSDFIACGVQLINEDGTPQISGNYAMKGGLNYLLPLPYVGAFIKMIANLVKVKKPNVPSTQTTIEVDWINGAFLMVKKQVIDKAGLLDEDFFLYAEEAEWCSRLQKQGKLCIYGQYSVIHLQGEVSNDAFNTSGKGYYNIYDKRGLQIVLSNMVRIRKQFGVGWFLFILFIYTFTIPVFLIIGLLHQMITPTTNLFILKRWSGLTKNVYSVWRKCLIITLNKPYFYKVL